MGGSPGGLTCATLKTIRRMLTKLRMLYFGTKTMQHSTLMKCPGTLMHWLIFVPYPCQYLLAPARGLGKCALVPLLSLGNISLMLFPTAHLTALTRNWQMCSTAFLGQYPHPHPTHVSVLTRSWQMCKSVNSILSSPSPHLTHLTSSPSHPCFSSDEELANVLDLSIGFTALRCNLETILGNSDSSIPMLMFDSSQ